MAKESFYRKQMGDIKLLCGRAGFQGEWEKLPATILNTCLIFSIISKLNIQYFIIYFIWETFDWIQAQVSSTIIQKQKLH